MTSLKITSWNVNGLRAVTRKGALQEFLEKHAPDVLFLQEIKAKPEQLGEFRNPSDYQAFYNSAERPGYSGTALWLKQAFLKKLKQLKNLDFKGATFQAVKLDVTEDNQGRICELRLDFAQQSLYLLGVYFPNGGSSDKAFEDKLIFYDKFLSYVNSLREKGHSCLWCGDINSAHTEIDLARPKENDGKVGFHPKERAWLGRCIAQHWVDAYRHLHGDKKEIYSWWSFRAGARQRNVGWRIDYFFLCPKSLKNLVTTQYLNQQEGSDHCPLSLELKLR